MHVTLYSIAERFIGIKEVPGSDDNPQILAMLNLDKIWPEHDEIPWCSGFVNYICWILDIRRSKSLMARSWLDIGMSIKLENAKVGSDIVILRRGNNPVSGHVGFYSGRSDHVIYLLGGNQSNTVSVNGYSINRLLDIRRLC